MRAARRPYSIAVAPDSSFRNRVKIVFMCLPCSGRLVSGTKLTMTVSQILLSNKTDGTCCQAKTDWKIANNGGTARPCQLLTPSNTAPVSITTIPTGFTTSSSTSGPIVVADVTYEDIPGFSFQLWHWKVWKTFNVAQTQYCARAARIRSYLRQQPA